MSHKIKKLLRKVVKDNQKHSNKYKEMSNRNNRLQKDHRSRLLYSLGFQRNQNEEGTHDVNLLSADKPRRESLNDSENIQWETTFAKRPRRYSRIRERLVQFDSDVMVKPIASHKQYSNRIKHELWNDLDEIRENAHRNQVEYQSEGMEWESVLEDEDMYVDANTGELIHPYWIENEDENSILFSS